jgi:threonine dehydratase
MEVSSRSELTKLEELKMQALLVDDIHLVTDAQLLSAVEHLYINEQIVAEPTGAATTAAWLAHSEQAPNGTVVLLVTGSNIATGKNDVTK